MNKQELRKEIEDIIRGNDLDTDAMGTDYQEHLVIKSIDQLLSLFQKREEETFTELVMKIGKHAMSCKNEYTDAIKEIKERKSE